MKNIYSIYKPKGPTSFTTINQIKKITGEGRVGHAGTLDPLASGVLVVGIGREATRELDKIVAKEKEYIADIRLGMTSDTDDKEGIKVESRKLKVRKLIEIKKEQVRSVLNNFVGNIDQVPPKFSAIKVDGQRAYKLARKGNDVKLKPRKVEIKNIKILKYKYPNLKIKVTCGKGTYIRSLARDIGKELGVGGYLADLERTRVGVFTKNKSISLEKIKKYFDSELIKKLRSGKIGVIPTDTIYGLLGSALNKKTVARIYEVRKRKPDKPFIVLISNIKDLKLFKIKINKQAKSILEKYWPGKVSIIIDCQNKEFEYLHRGGDSLAFRLPKDEKLINILKKTGPLIAPSANPEGFSPAKTIKQAKRYFSNQVDFYIDRGKIEGNPSTLLKIKDGNVETLRK